MRDKTEISLGLNPLEVDMDEDGILDSAEIITQPIDLEIVEPIDINTTLVKPSVELTGAGDYYGKLYALPLIDYPVIDQLGCVVGNAFEFLHDESLTFQSSTLTFTISDSILQSTPLGELAIAYYDYDNNIFELLDTTYTVSGGAITMGTVPRVVETVSGSAITVQTVTGSAIGNKISTEVTHYSTYMVVNKQRYYDRNITPGNTSQNYGIVDIRLSNGTHVRLLKDPFSGDRSVDTDGDELCDLDELGFPYYAQAAGSSQPVVTWTFHTNPASADTDKDGIKDNSDYYDNLKVIIDFGKHSVMPGNMFNGDNYFVDIYFNKYPYCVNNTRGEYVLQAERWLKKLGRINTIDGKYDGRDIYAVAYLQNKYNIGSNGIIDNRTNWLLWTLNEIDNHKNDVKLGIKTQEELDTYNANIMRQLLQPQCQNPDYTKDYYTFYYNMMLNHALIGIEGLKTVLELFPGGDAVDITIFLTDILNYKPGDKGKIISDLAALGIDVTFEFADELIIAAKKAKNVVSKALKEAVETAASNLRAIGIADETTVVKIADKIAAAMKRGSKFTVPTLPKGGLPKGVYEVPKGDQEVIRSITRQNEAADLLAREGYEIEMLPYKVDGNGFGLKPLSNPDFRILGKVFDCYSPKTSIVRNIWTEVQKKTLSQGRNIILNLDDFTGSMDDLAKQFLDYPIDTLYELLIIKDGKIARLIIK